MILMQQKSEDVYKRQSKHSACGSSSAQHCRRQPFQTAGPARGYALSLIHIYALMTLAEYLVDYAREDTKNIGFELINKELEKIPNEKTRSLARKHIEDIKASNRRDFRF